MAKSAECSTFKVRRKKNANNQHGFNSHGCLYIKAHSPHGSVLCTTWCRIVSPFDLHNITDLTPDSPLAISTTPGLLHTWRYSHWMMVEDELLNYAEVANPNQSHEVRLFRIGME